MPTPDIKSLQIQAKILLKNSLAPTTRNKYTSYFKTYTNFCQLINIATLPISQDTLILFATHLCPNNSHKSISAHIAAIKFTAEIQGYDPDLFPYNRLYRVIRGIKRTQGARFKKPPRIPITPDLLSQLGRNLWNSTNELQDKLMLWTTMLTAFHGFLRVSEYTASHIRRFDPLVTLCYEDVIINSHNSITIRI